MRLRLQGVPEEDQEVDLPLRDPGPDLLIASEGTALERGHRRTELIAEQGTGCGGRVQGMGREDRPVARIEHDRALQKVLVELLSDHTELFKQHSDNPAFKKWLADTIFSVTYEPPAA